MGAMSCAWAPIESSRTAAETKPIFLVIAALLVGFVSPGCRLCTVGALSHNGPPNGKHDIAERHPSPRSYSSTASSSTCAPAAHCSKVVDSASLWLMPSWQGTKIMVVGATREA